MSSTVLSKFFPPPRYLVMPAAGLDISDQSIKWFGVLPGRQWPQVVGWGEAAVPVGLLESGKIRNPSELVNILRELKEKMGFTYVTASLPEEQTYLFRLSLPLMDESELRESIELQLEEHVPLRPQEAVFDFEIVSRPDKTHSQYEVAVSVMPRAMLEEYIKIMASAGLEVKALEIEGHSLARALLPHGDQSTVLIVDIGKVRTGFSIISKGTLLYTSTLDNIGGEDITASIQKNLNLSREEAERLKVAKGVANTTGDRELFFALVPVLSTLKDEIARVDSYWREHPDEGGLSRPPVEAVILSGGQSSLPGLIDYMRGNLSVPVSIGNPWVNIVPPSSVPPVEFQQSLRFTTAVGLALRNLQL
jgi:type IV pilus assembly protein PilM